MRVKTRFAFILATYVVLALSAPVMAKPSTKARAAPIPAKITSPARDERAKGPVPIIEQTRSVAAARVIDWIATSDDNRALPYIVIDKQAANLFLFDATGKPLGNAPVLIGIATGDESSPGVGSKTLSRIGPAERTTPAGRFLAKYGIAAGGEKVLWVDYADSVALHAVITTNKKERRLQRLRSPTAADHRITFGCINVPTSFYQKRIRSLFQKKGGFVYILPDTRPLESVFPRLLTQPFLASKTE